MNNTTVTDDGGWSNLPWYIIYTVQGSLVSTGNTLIVVTIARYEALRNNKEYMLIFALSLADTFNMLGYFFGGTFRIDLLAKGIHNGYHTAAYCMSTMQNICWSIGPTLATMMLTAVSVDRLLCMLFPLSYLGWTTSYTRSLLGVVYGVNIASAGYILASAYGVEGLLVGAKCVPEPIIEGTTNRFVFWYYTQTPQLNAICSVAIYLLVVVLYKRKHNAELSEHPNQQYELKRQRKVTITLSVSALCTFCLFVVPYASAAKLYANGYYNIALSMWCTANINPFVNVFLYPLRHAEMKQGLKAMISCKPMPHDLKLWKQNTTTGSIPLANNFLPPPPNGSFPAARPAAKVHAV